MQLSVKRPVTFHGMHILGHITRFIRTNFMMCIAALAALISCIFIPVDATYLTYFDIGTLVCLFCTLAVVCALKNIRFFYIMARWIVSRFRTTRYCVLALVFITYIGSMLLANDMALLTFLPLGYFVLSAGKCTKYMAFTFTMQSIAANLGGMLTPFGNPQNLYLYSKFAIPNDTFISIMLPPFLVASVLIALCCLFIRNEKMVLEKEEAVLDKKRAAFYLVLFAVAIAVVLRVVPYYVGLPVIVIALLFTDRKALLQVDYPLLLTFVFFFIFAGNMGRVDFVRDTLGGLLHSSPLLVSTLSCQFISNVPSAILLSQFSSNYAPLLIGVNIGGVGTLISSLASLITFREYCTHDSQHKGRYLLIFSALNFGFLIVLLAFMLLTT